MVTSLLLGTVLLAPAAPVPEDAVTNPTSPAPQVAYLHADANGNVNITGYTFKIVKQNRSRSVVENGQRVVKTEQVDVRQQVHFSRSLSGADMKLNTADGKELSNADALARVKSGAVVLISADGKPVEKAWLRAFGTDTIVVSSENLTNCFLTTPQATGNPTTPAPRLVLLAADAEGRIMVAHNPASAESQDFQMEQVEQQALAVRGNIVVMNGRAVQRNFDVATPGVPAGQTEFPGKLLDDVKFDAFDLQGIMVPRSEAMKRLKAGGLVLIAGDGRLPDQRYLNVFRGEMLVLVSNELTLPAGATVKPSIGILRNAGGVAPVPAAPLVPAARQLNIAPAPAAKPLNAVPVPVAKPLNAVPLPAPVARPKAQKFAPRPAVEPVPVPAQEDK